MRVYATPQPSAGARWPQAHALPSVKGSRSPGTSPNRDSARVQGRLRNQGQVPQLQLQEEGTSALWHRALDTWISPYKWPLQSHAWPPKHSVVSLRAALGQISGAGRTHTFPFSSFSFPMFCHVDSALVSQLVSC